MSAPISNFAFPVSAPRDVCARKHRGNPESAAANARAHTAKYETRALIYNWLLIAGSRGGTCWEISRETGMAYTTCSARLSELKAEAWVAPARGADEKVLRRKTSTGSWAAVLRAVTAAERARSQQRSLFAASA